MDATGAVVNTKQVTLRVTQMAGNLFQEHGATKHIPVGLGTLQGDVLSPALWGIFLVPLLRWIG